MLAELTAARPARRRNSDPVRSGRPLKAWQLVADRHCDWAAGPAPPRRAHPRGGTPCRTHGPTPVDGLFTTAAEATGG